MNYINKKKLDNVRAFTVFNETLCYNSLNSVFIYENEIILKSEISLLEIKYDKNILYINDIQGSTYLIKHEVIFLKDIYFIFILNEDEVLVETLNGTEILNLKSNKLKAIIDDRIFTFTIIEKILYYTTDTHIHAYSLPDATPLWQYDVSELGAYDVLFSTEKRNYEVVKFLGVWQEELLVAFQGSLLMAFDVQTGKVTRQWQELPAHADEELRNIFRGKIHEKGTVFQLNLAGDKIVAIYLRHYLEIDLVTGEIHVKNLSQTLHQHLMVDFNHKSGYAEDETHFYSTVHLDQEKLGLKYIPTALCALNKSTLEIDWFHRFDQDGTGDYVSVQIPQVAHNKLYQLTQNNVLYVLEKE